jgi:tight adherence protein C
VLLIVGLGALGAALVVGVLVFVVDGGPRSDVARSLAAIEKRYAGALTATPASNSPEDRSFTERIVQPFASRLGSLGRTLTAGGSVARLQRHLDYAGNPTAWPVERVVAAKGIGLVVGGVVGLLVGLFLGGLAAIVLSLLGGVVLGFFGPDIMIYNVGAKRQDELRSSLPDVLDTLTISVEAGQGFDAALAQVSRNGRGPITGEVARVLQEMRIGKARTDALRSLSARTTVPELKGFAAAIVQASDLGVPVGQVLREQSRDMRLKRRQHAEELAQKVPIKILFPTMFCLFPALFIVVIGPGVLNMMKNF